MFQKPALHKCQKCGFECHYSKDYEHPAPVFPGIGFIGCPRCYELFVAAYVGHLNPVSAPASKPKPGQAVKER